jgi:type VI secretion system protein ImpM
MGVPNIPGFYGKVPVLGDFVCQRLPAFFVKNWDTWLQNGLSASRQELGDNWLDIYLTSPIWRFAMREGACGATAWAGILMPSVDRVGRYFPLTLAAKIDGSQALPNLFISAAKWFDKLEQLALTALEDDFDLAEFDRSLQEQILDLPLGLDEIHCVRHHTPKKDDKIAYRITMEKLEDMRDAFIQLSAYLLADLLPVYSLWSTTGSERMKPSLLVYEDLPPRIRYTELLAGQNQPEGRGGESAVSFAVAETTGQKPVEAQHKGTDRPVRLQWRSCARSTVGKRRKLNEDAYLERPEIGLWAVADGMGGHSAGDVASQTVVKALSLLSVSDNLETLTASTTECLHQVNADLLRMADALGPDQIIGTTVVVMLAVGEHCAVIWVGDSRLYCYRDGELSQLTHDHSLAAELSLQGVNEPQELDGAAADNIVTRALGADPELLIDTITFEAQPDDVYLLCSDGLVKEVAHHEIADSFSRGGCQQISQVLIDLALARGARDNVTVIVACADEA